MKQGRVWLTVLVVWLGWGLFTQIGKAEDRVLQLVPQEATWKFHDLGPDAFPGDTWKDQDFDDTAWQSGQAPLGYSQKEHIQTKVGYGENDSSKYPVTFFRKQVEVTKVAEALAKSTALRLQLKIDDSAIIYLNGQEIARQNYAATGEPNFKDYSGKLGDDGKEFQEQLVDLTKVKAALVEGNNEFAVAVFQQSGTSSDLVFDLAADLVQTSLADTQPTKISTTFYGNTLNQKAVTWHTEQEAGTYIRYQIASVQPTEWSQSQYASGTSQTVAVIGGYVHKVVLTDLAAATSYWYQVGDRNTNTWSEAYQLKTQKTSGPLRFLFYDDTQGSNEYDY